MSDEGYENGDGAVTALDGASTTNSDARQRDIPQTRDTFIFLLMVLPPSALDAITESNHERLTETET